MEDSIWASFCQCTSNYTFAFLEKKGYRWMYKRWSTPVVKRRPPSALGLPSCPAENFYSLVQVKYEKNTVYSRSISGRRLLPFCF
jgi:hypothetical protein